MGSNWINFDEKTEVQSIEVCIWSLNNNWSSLNKTPINNDLLNDLAEKKSGYANKCVAPFCANKLAHKIMYWKIIYFMLFFNVILRGYNASLVLTRTILESDCELFLVSMKIQTIIIKSYMYDLFNDVFRAKKSSVIRIKKYILNQI